MEFQTTYIVQPVGLGGYRIVGPGGTLDMHTSYAAAEYFARLLNTGRATFDPHACVGCRVS